MNQEALIRETIRFVKETLAEERHNFMEQFLQQFYKEWDGEG